MKLLLTLVFICNTVICLSQTPKAFSVEEWVTRLSDPGDKKNSWFDEITGSVTVSDSAAAFNFLEQVEKKAHPANEYFAARINCIKASLCYYKDLTPIGVVLHPEIIKKKIKELMTAALNTAYSTNDDYLIAFVSGCYGSSMLSLQETEPAVTYLTNCTDLYEKIGVTGKMRYYIALGEIMWGIREYDKCIQYTKKGYEALMATFTDQEAKDLYTMFCFNTIGLAYQRQGQYDSAFACYHTAMQAQPKTNKPVWKGILSGNTAQIYFDQGKFKDALPLFELDYSLSKQYELYSNAANSLQWAARTNLALGKKDSALIQVREAFDLLKKEPQANYLRNAYLTASQVFKAFNNTDSSFYYGALYNKLHDSIERVIYQSGVNIARLHLAEEKNRYNIQNLQKEKQEQVRQRNYIIAGIIVISCFVLLLISRRNQQLKFKQQLNEQEKRRIEQEMQAAKEQLQLFTQSIIEKTQLIEKLESQLQANALTVQQQENLSELSELTILTDDDWVKFKKLFDKTYPLFFQQLKAKSPDITLAEQRMAALTRLQLTTKQMASMQGISPDSVHKTRQRLRQRLGLNNEVNLEEYFAGV